MQGILCIKEPLLLMTSLHLIFVTLLIDLSLPVMKCNTVLGMPEDMLLSFFPARPCQAAQPEVF